MPRAYCRDLERVILKARRDFTRRRLQYRPFLRIQTSTPRSALKEPTMAVTRQPWQNRPSHRKEADHAIRNSPTTTQAPAKCRPPDQGPNGQEAHAGAQPGAQESLKKAWGDV